MSDEATLHIIDLENHLSIAGRKISEDDVKSWYELYERHFVGPRDLVIVGVSPKTSRWLRAFAGKRVQSRIGHTGPDGADDILLASIYVPDMADRYRQWNVASGDGAFTGIVRQASQRGVFVRLVTTGDTRIAPKLWAASAVHSKIRLTSRSTTLRNAAAIRGVYEATVAA